MKMIPPDGLSLKPKYIKFLEQQTLQHANRFWNELMWDSLYDRANNTGVVLSPSHKGDFSLSHTEHLIRTKSTEDEVQLKSPFFTNILRIPEFDPKARRAGMSGWEPPSERIVNGGWMVFTFESDTLGLEAQLDWFMGKSPIIDQVHQTLKGYKDYRGFNAVFSGNKSVHIHIWFDSRHLTKALSKGARRKAQDWDGDMPPAALKEWYRRKWLDLLPMIKGTLGAGVEFDHTLSFYGQKRRTAWAHRVIQDQEKNIHGIRAYHAVQQTVVGESFLSRSAPGADLWFLDAASSVQVLQSERSASCEPSRHPIAPNDSADLVADLAAYLRENNLPIYPEPVDITYHEPHNYAWFRNHAGDVHPRTFVRGDYRRFAPNGQGAPTKPLMLPHEMTLDQTLMVLKQRGFVHDHSQAPKPVVTTSYLDYPELRGMAAKRFAEQAVTTVSARASLTAALWEAIEFPGVTMVQSVEGIGKTRALMEKLPELRWTSEHRRLGFICFACRSYDQCYQKRDEFITMHGWIDPKTKQWVSLRAVVLRSFSWIYEQAAQRADVDMIDGHWAGKHGFGSLLEAIQRTQPDVYRVMKEIRAKMWGLTRPNSHFDPSTITIFMTHAMAQGWPSSMITKAWLHPNCPDTCDPLILKEYARKMGLCHVVYDEISEADIVSRHSIDLVLHARNVEDHLTRTTRDGWGEAKLPARVAAFDQTFGGQPGAAPIDFGECDEILRMRYRPEDLVTVSFKAHPFGKGTDEANVYAQQDGLEFYCRQRRWWSGLGCPVTILTTEDLPVELALAINRAATEKPEPFRVARLLSTQRLFTETVPVRFDTRARSPRDGANSSTVGSVVDIANEFLENGVDFVIGNKLKNRVLPQFSDQVGSHDSSRGRNDLRGKSIVTIITYLGTEEYAGLNVLGQRFGLIDPIRMHYRDVLFQDLGRNLGFRHEPTQDHYDHVVVIKPELYGWLNGFETDVPARYRFYVMGAVDEAA
jgi:hypothetical protein